MKTIWKYHLDITDVQQLIIPLPASLLTVGVQDGNLCVWALVDPDKTLMPVDIYIYGTGNPVRNAPGKYVGTVQNEGYVWHVFEGGYRLS